MPLSRDPEKLRAWRERSKPLRADPDKVREWLDRSRAPLERHVEWNTPEAEARRRERVKRIREEQFSIADGYRQWVIEQPCAACGTYDPEAGSQPAHVGKTRGAGAKADRQLSLCWECHDWETRRRNEFNAAFKARHGVTPEEMALYRYEMYHRDQG